MANPTSADEHAIKSHIESLNNLQVLLACKPHLKARREHLEVMLNRKDLEESVRTNVTHEVFRLKTLETEIQKRVFHQGVDL